MDILTHALSGTAIAVCAASFVKPDALRRTKIIAVGTFGGIIPDVDAISLWSPFNGTFGRLFDLSHSGGDIYSGKFRYSHHAFFHSLLAGVLIGLLLLEIGYLLKRLFSKNKKGFLMFIRTRKIYFITFFLAFVAHLPTPASTWGGVRMFFPLSDYVGGYGNIWWWNNYDIFLLIGFCIIINFGVLFLQRFLKEKVKYLSVTVLVITFTLILIQINTRQYDYAYSGSTNRYAEMESNSKKEQERILGKRIYIFMEKLDSKLPIYF